MTTGIASVLKCFIIVSLAGAAAVGLVIRKFVDGDSDSTWEYMFAVILGAGLLVWPAAIVTNRAQDKEIQLLLQILELETLDRFRLENTESGQQLNFVVDPETGEIQLEGMEVAEEEVQSDVEAPEEVQEQSKALPEGA